jgi:nucleotide-binding universal stress UspA family protein
MFRRILIPLDGSSLAEQALGQGATIARASGASVDVVSIYEPIAVSVAEHDSLDLAGLGEIGRYVERIATELSATTGVPTTHATFKGDPIELIASRAREIDADLIVLTSHGRTGLSRMWLGSVADGLVRRSRVPVLLLRPINPTTEQPPAHRLYETILVPLDGSAASEEVMPVALALAKCGGGRILLLHVVELIPLVSAHAATSFGYTPAVFSDLAITEMKAAAKLRLDGVAARIRDKGINVEVHIVVEMSVAQTILEFARSHGVDVIAISTHGRGISRLVVGSVADKVLRGGDLPLLAYSPASE